jgi:NADH-quinone oxidoreductase subunit E
MAPDYSLQPFGDEQTRATLPTNADAGRSNFRTSVINLDRPGDPSVFSDQVRADAQELIARYPAGQGRSALLPLLHLVQSEQGYVTPDGIAFCADVLELTKAQVAAVATFYTMYKRSPTGEYLVSVCTNTLCGMLGGDEIFAALKEQLGIGNNQTTPDGMITLEHAECLAACDYAPVVTVNYEFFDNQTVGGARNIVSQLQSGDRPMPTRGAPLCTFKQIERQIAGFFDEAALAPDSNGSGVPTEVGVKLAIERGDTAPSYSLDDAPAAAHPKPAAIVPAAKRAPKPATKPADKPAAAAPAAAQPAAANATADKPAAEKATTADKAPRKRAVRRPAPPKQTTGKQPTLDDAGEADQPTSQHDAPLETAQSDPANESEPGTEKGE